MSALPPNALKQVRVQIPGRVGKRRKDEHFAVFPSVFRRGRVRHFLCNFLFEFRQFGVPRRCNDLCFIQKILKLRSIMADGLTPLGNIDVAQVEFPLPAHDKVVVFQFRIVQVLRHHGVVINVRAGFRVYFKRRELVLKRVNFFDCSRKRQAKGIHRAFEPLEQVDLHHADQNFLASFLGEAAEDFILIRVPDRLRQVGAKMPGRVVEGERQLADFFIQFLKRQVPIIQVYGGMNRAWGGTAWKFADPGHFVLVVSLNLLAGTSDAQSVKQLEKIAADCL